MTPSNTYLTVSLTGTKEVTSNDLAAVYRDWMSNYLSVAAFAEDYGITIAQAEVTIAKGREIHDAHADWLKEFAHE
ncbi:TPA: hypothetical protein ACUJSM_004413 [Klebsiella pneumoniae]|uniref:hypothetical protein n=1 Tax=Klebsiella pneumoniae TaxID=573 RepID=UPI00296E8257|nr:hypothetical protein [Klebsiella pneumoniae]MDW3810587.1 hypothetical protein [Klebsiella pneumoniae]HBW3447962.1 hypothetical protein [Klebsiella pneumoniae]